MKYFDTFKPAQVNVKLSKGKPTKYEELNKSERDDGSNTNQDKMVEVKCLAMNLLGCADPGIYKTVWSILRKNHLTTAENFPNTLTDSSNLLVHYRPPVTHTIPRDIG